MPNIVTPEAAAPIVTDDGVMQILFQRWVEEITQNDLLIGTGSPEGVVSANQGRRYMDETGTTGNILYIKQLDDIGGDKTQGWILV